MDMNSDSFKGCDIEGFDCPPDIFEDPVVQTAIRDIYARSSLDVANYFDDKRFEAYHLTWSLDPYILTLS